MFRKYI